MPNDIDQAPLVGLIEHMRSCLAYPDRGIPDTLGWLRDVICCDGIILCQVRLSPASSIRHIANHNYHPEWVRTYLAQDFGTIDPVIRYAYLASNIYSWEDAYKHFEDCCPATFFETAAHYGLHTGFACRFYQDNSEIMTVCSLCVESNVLKPTARWVLYNAMPALHTATNGMDKNKSIRPLSLRESEVLKWASEGKTVWEIGMILSLSEGTVKFHLRNIYRKLDVTNRAQAIATAAHQGLI
ncbi:helix-turn-helix transcriptional regulator [Aidingimonas halophila]|uniref:Transcriptional regulator, LuxR family n=1 Tax=Aidingimonas halophila TaxID=574349 RepID=A0A1H3A0P3_9GAMM|nr:LuxR family transcriptional regulator [Aidingimonas halophila]SDX23195.1 transcriptional regulator, LuxR family [Aidingimonas halophila]